MGKYRENWTNEKIFSRLKNNKSNKTYWDNISALRRRPCKVVFDMAYKLACSENEKEMIIGVQVLAQLGSDPRYKQKEALNLFFKLLEKEQKWNVLMVLLYAIGHNNESLSEEQIQGLIKYSDKKSSIVREALAIALGGVESEAAIDTLIGLSADSNTSVRDWATFGLGTLNDFSNPKIIDALWARTADEDQNTKLEAIVGLAKRNDNRVKGVIIEEIKRGEYGTLLFEAIELFPDKDFLPYLIMNFEKDKDDDSIDESWLEDLKKTIEKLEEI